MTEDERNIDELELRRRLRELRENELADETEGQPRPQTESGRSRRGRIGGGSEGGGTNRPTAVGYGDSGGERFKPGQNVPCKVVSPEPGGYEVIIPKGNLKGFLPTDATLKPGEEVLAQFVCFANNRVLLSAPLLNSELTVRGKYQAATPTSYPAEPDSARTAESVNDHAFGVWAKNELGASIVRRATDLIPPPLGDDKGQRMLMADEDLEWLVTDVEGGMRTGCIQTVCNRRRSRAAMLLYRGRVVGCTYNDSVLLIPAPTEDSLKMMLNGMAHPDTQVWIYELPAEMTLAMSALYLGYPVERNDDLDGRSYLDYIGSWLQQKEQTACIVITSSNQSTCLAFVCKGRYIGSFCVEQQQYDSDISFVFDLLDKDRGANVRAYILPPEMTSSSVRFGFSLSQIRKDLR